MGDGKGRDAGGGWWEQGGSGHAALSHATGQAAGRWTELAGRTAGRTASQQAQLSKAAGSRLERKGKAGGALEKSCLAKHKLGRTGVATDPKKM